jgi:UDP-N-acetylglucosamine transferase subunit ALG13
MAEPFQVLSKGPAGASHVLVRIFVTVGWAFQPFEMLLGLVHSAMLACSEPIEGVCQTGYSWTEPFGLRAVRRLPRDEFERQVAAADVVICHGGVGALASAWAHGHLPLVVARRAALGEHFNDHQREIVAQLARAGRLVDAEDGITEALLRRARGARRPGREEEPQLDALAAALKKGRGRPLRWRELPLRMLGACAPAASRLR